ncbi:MAG: site-specific integrase [Clostridia bacterium]|nr:site-specific integrase [Clostridia bacterium]
MSVKTNVKINGQNYYRITKTVGKKINENGIIVAVRKQFMGKSKKDAEQKYEEYMARRSQGMVDKSVYFGIIAEEWIYNFFLKDTHLKENTKNLYVGHWNNYIKPSALYSMPLNEITAASIQSLYNSLPAPVSVVRAIHNLMCRFYRYLELEGYARNFTGTLVVPKPKTSPGQFDDPDDLDVTIWEDDEIVKILNGFDEADPRFRLRFLIILALNTGCRISELLAIKYTDIDGNSLRINKQVIRRPYITKEKRTEYKLELDTPKTPSSVRMIPLNSLVLQELERHRKQHMKEMQEKGYETPFVFSTDSGNLYDYRNLVRACKRYYDTIGVEAKGFHTYRHTFGTLLCRNGIPIQVAASLLGHTDINVTARYYINVSDAEKTDAVESIAALFRPAS